MEGDDRRREISKKKRKSVVGICIFVKREQIGNYEMNEVHIVVDVNGCYVIVMVYGPLRCYEDMSLSAKQVS